MRQITSTYFVPCGLKRLVGGLLGLALTASIQAGEPRIIPGHVPAAVAQLQPVAAVPGTNHLRLIISLPLRNQTELNGLLGELTDPSSTNYHQWLTPDQFTRRFGPTEADYEKVLGFARTNGLEVKGVCSNRMLVDVEAPVTRIEQTFHLTLNNYPHPTEARNFYAPDTEPSADPNIPILHVRGLDNFIRPHRLGGSPRLVPLNTSNPITAYATGSGPGGNFMGRDFRTAYVPGVTNTGAGQYIGIIDVGGPYYPLDVYMYETNAGLSTNTVITNILLSGWTGIPVGTNENLGEEVLDIDMAMSMAPGATILNYEGESDDVFNQIASDNKAKQMTLSYGFGLDAANYQSFQQFLAQGQAMSQASGDGGADLNGGTGLTGNPYATIVGGVSLTTSSAGGPYQSDPTWGGSGGGISGYGIPNWQQGISMTTNQGSTSFRNYPDVAMPADNIFTVYEDGSIVGGTGGTSAASPLWAGFMALVNQQAAALGKPAVGYVNPALYAIGKGPYAAYTNCFHDETTGNTYNSHNPTRYAACPGYDLCTGWGSPTGSNTIAALVGSGTNNFDFNAFPDAWSLVQGGTAASTLTLSAMNGFTGSVTFSLSGLPAGVTAALSPATTTTSSLLTLTTTSTTALGTNLITITATSGTLVHSLTLSLAITAPVPGAVQVSLASLYNRPGIWTDSRTFNGGLDGGSYAYSANLLGTAPSWNGIAFTLGPTNANDAVSCSGQTITLPAGNFTTLQFLGTAVDGAQAAQKFIVTYTDNTTATNTQSLSDWANPQSYAGESKVVAMTYRNYGGGSKDLNTAVNLYGYSLTLNQTKTVKSLTLPNNSDVEILALVLADDPVSAPLTAYFNRAGMYTDNTTFTNPATGGADGGGNAYSATLLTGSQSWSNIVFNFGPANVTNVVSAANQTIALPNGYFSSLRMLASGVNGDQASQTFTVYYTNGTSTAFVQGLSDWYTPANYTGEAKALIEGHRNSSNGTADNSTFYVYGYSFKLTGSKAVQSIKLPNNGNVIVLAISLVPILQPAITTLPAASTISYGQTLASATLSGGVASVAGTFAFTTPAITPVAGTASQSVTFTPTDTTDYTTVITNVSVTVNPATPTITTPPTASTIIYGQTLAGSTLSGGVASVPGAFAFTTPATAPTAGTASQSVTFTPTDTNDYNTVTFTVTVQVNPAIPTITTAPTAGALTYGQTLASAALTGGVASVPGRFAFTTPATVPTAGTAAQSVTFTPTDATDFNPVILSVSVTVNKATPTIITAPTASVLYYGQALASATLNGGVASVPGGFAFTSPALLPNLGAVSQSVTFTPADSADYNPVTLSVNVVVTKGTVTTTVDPTQPWIGYMNVYQLPAHGGGYQFGSAWGTTDLQAGFTGASQLILQPCTNVWETTDTYWVQADGATPNDIMDASFYVQNDSLVNDSVFFTGTCLSNSLTAAPEPLTGISYISTAFIKMFDGGYNLLGSVTNPLVAGQAFSLTLNAVGAVHVQYGFETIGPDANPATAAALGDVVVGAAYAPAFSLNPVTEPGLVAGQDYAADLATNATDLNGDALTFAIFSGPAWLGLSPAGALSGQPLSVNVGTNTFGVSVSDPAGLSNTATLYITVSPAPPIVLGLTGAAPNLWLSWSGGIAPYQVQTTTNLAAPIWLNAGGVISSNSVIIQPGIPAAFYRIMGQ